MSLTENSAPRGRNSQERKPDGTERDFEFRPLTESDLPLLGDWLSRPHIMNWWPSPGSMEELGAEYLPTDLHGAARAYLAFVAGEPVGYIQYYVVAEGDPEWWPDDPVSGTLGIDQFLAADDMLGKGVGRAMIREFVEFLFQDQTVRQIRVDPHPENRRAIRCYERVGFQSRGPIRTPDGPALLMTLDRPDAKVNSSSINLNYLEGV